MIFGPAFLTSLTISGATLSQFRAFAFVQLAEVEILHSCIHRREILIETLETLRIVGGG